MQQDWLEEVTQFPQRLRQRIRDARAAGRKGISVESVARHAAMHPSQLTRLLNNRSRDVLVATLVRVELAIRACEAECAA